jgi:hypothetical protein
MIWLGLACKATALASWFLGLKPSQANHQLQMKSECVLGEKLIQS